MANNDNERDVKTEENTQDTSKEERDTTPAESIPEEDAVAADEESKEHGENVSGVLSPDPKVGEHVPSELVMPGEVVDPKTGKVMEGSTNPTVVTPRPNLPENDADSRRAPEGKPWAGNHTV